MTTSTVHPGIRGSRQGGKGQHRIVGGKGVGQWAQASAAGSHPLPRTLYNLSTVWKSVLGGCSSEKPLSLSCGGLLVIVNEIT